MKKRIESKVSRAVPCWAELYHAVEKRYLCWSAQGENHLHSMQRKAWTVQSFSWRRSHLTHRHTNRNSSGFCNTQSWINTKTLGSEVKAWWVHICSLPIYPQHGVWLAMQISLANVHWLVLLTLKDDRALRSDPNLSVTDVTRSNWLNGSYIQCQWY